MKKVREDEREYEFSKGVRSEHAKTYREGTNLVALDKDVVGEFPTSKAVNDALRELLKRRSTS